MSRRILNLVTVLTLSLVLGLPPALVGPNVMAQAARLESGEASAHLPPNLQTLAAKAQANGSLNVLVSLDVAFTPEGKLSLAERLDQRQQIAALQQQVLDGLAGQNFTLKNQYDFIPALGLAVDAASLAALSQMAAVTSVDEEIILKPTLNSSRGVVQADDAYTAGYTGSGYTVAILDTGVEKTHSFIGSSRVVSEACYSEDPSDGFSACPDGSTSSIATGSGIDCTARAAGYSNAIDECRHGTHVAGIAAGDGDGTYIGMAPNASLIAIQVFYIITDTATCGTSAGCTASSSLDFLLGMDRVYALYTSGMYTITSVNLSLGVDVNATSYCDTGIYAPYKTSIDNLRSVGIATVIATGNGDVNNEIEFPGCISTAVSVATTSDSDLVADFVSIASFVDLLAPGVDIVSSVPGNTTAEFDGTSMATPHVAGAWAVIRSAFPGASVSEIQNALTSTATLITDTTQYNASTSSNTGSGLTNLRRINIYDAMLGLCTSGAVTVTNANNSGLGSLRQAITNAACGGTIKFNADYNIYLTSTLTLNNDLTIDATGRTIKLSGDTSNNGSRDVQIFNIASGADVTLKNLTIVSGTATTGGAISNSGTLTITNSTLADNYSSSSGGAIYNASASSTLIISNTTFSANTSNTNGGGAIRNNGTLTLTNSTLSGNIANGGGGGGGLYAIGTETVRNTLIANSTGSDCTGGLNTFANNLIEDASCSATYSGDPRLSSLGSYGGQTQTFAPLPGSKAINNGNATYCSSTDQRGSSRFGTCDIGAFESQGFSLAITSGNNQSTGVNQAFATALAITVTANSASEPVGSGGYVTFTAPSSGASLSSITLTATTAANGSASVSATANGTSGSYSVSVTTTAASSSINFSLTNLADACFAEYTGDNTTDFSSTDASAVQNAVDAASSGGTVKVAGTCAGVESGSPVSHTVYIDKNLTVQGGYTTTNWLASANSDTYPTYLDAQGQGRVVEIASGTSVTLSHLYIENGYAWASSVLYSGGNIVTNGNLIIANTTITDGYAYYGGGIYATNSGTLKVSNSLFARNATTNYGGGIHVNSGTAIITNTTFYSNQVFFNGGGLSAASGTVVTVTNSTFTNNLADWNTNGGDGGGIAQAGTAQVYLVNTLIADNFDNTAGAADCYESSPSGSGGIFSSGYNVIGSTTGCTLSTTVTDKTNVSALPGSLADNGGPTLSVAPQSGSPALEMTASGTNGCGTTITTDQRGTSRPQSGACDAGAVEVTGLVCFAEYTGDSQTDYATTDAGAVRSALAAASAGGTVKIAGTCAGVATQSGSTQVALITTTLTLRGGYTTTNWTTSSPSVNNTTLNAQGAGRVLSITVAASLEGFTVTNGYINTSGTHGGAGIYATSALTLTNLIIYSNTLTGTSATASGGGAYIGGAAIVTGTAFTNNAIYGTGGGGGGARFLSTVAMTNTTFTNNQTEFGTGGGGGAFVGAASLAATTFTNNSAPFGFGGGGYFSSAATLTTTTFSANSGDLGGGAAFAGLTNVTNTLFLNNLAGAGGAVYHYNVQNGRYANVLLAGNSATGSGQAFYFANASTVQVLHSTIVSPTLVSGAAIYIQSTTTGITNTLIASHTIGIQRTGGTVTENYNLFSAVTTPYNGSITSGGNSITGTAVFVAPASNNYRLSTGSAGLNAGANEGVTFDIDNATRPQGNGYDIGYDETTYIASLSAANSGTTIVGNPVYFTATLTNGANFTYAWDFGDGQTASGATASHSYSSNGSYTAIVTATNAAGTLTATTPVTISAVSICFAEYTGDGVTDFSSSDASAVRNAVAAASVGGTVKMAGTCAGAIAQSGTTQVALITKTLTLQGGYTTTNWTTSYPATQTTTLDAENGGRVIYATANLTLTNLTLQNGLYAGNGGGAYITGTLTLSNTNVLSNTSTTGQGGGVQADGALTLTDTQFYTNTSVTNGGGAYGAGGVTIVGGWFQNNQCTGACSGGAASTNATLTVTEAQFYTNTAFHNGGALHGNGNIVINDTYLQGNTATTFQGGALAHFGSISSTIAISGTQFISNSATTNGGGVRLAGLTAITNTTFVSNTAGSNGGAAHFSTNTTMTDTTLTSNSAAQAGGGAYFNSTATLTGDTFQQNTAGASQTGGGAHFSAAATVSDTQFLTNTFSSLGTGTTCGTNMACGGGLYSASTLTLTNASLSGNSARRGGGLYANTTAILANTTVSDNTAATFGGGAYFNLNAVTITDSAFTNNTAGNNGGGADFNGAILTDVTFTGNTAGVNGGGAQFFGTTALTNTVFLRNTSGASGGAAYTTGASAGRWVNTLAAGNSAGTNGEAFMLNSTGNVEVIHATIVSPMLATGAAIYINSGTAGITNTLIASHTIGLQGAGGATSENYNLFDSVTTPFTGTLSNGGNSITGTVLFVDSASDDYHLSSGSAGLNAGTNTGVATDYDGEARPQGGGYDIGYDETMDAVSLSAANSSPTTLGQTTSFTATLTNGANFTFTWDFGDGSLFSSLQSPSHTYTATGSFTVIVTATNDVGTLSASKLVTVTNLEPVAEAGPDQTVLTNTIVTLDGSGSVDPDGHTPLTYYWTQTGGPAVTLTTPANVTTTFTMPSVDTTVTFTLAVTDSAGLADPTPDSLSVSTTDIPIGDLTATNDSPTELGVATSFTATIATGSNVTYQWDFGDGSVVGGQPSTVSHTYATIGVYTTLVTATNSAGSVSATTPVTITDVAITSLTATNDSPTELGNLTSFTATIASGSNVIYQWDFGDQSLVSNLQSPTHTYTSAGVYTAIVTATNSLGNVSASTVVTVQQTVTTATLTVSLTGAGSGSVTSNPAGINCNLDCSESYAIGTVVTLTASANIGSVFTGWSGDCSGTSVCVVTLDAARNVTATFDTTLVEYKLYLPLVRR